MKIEIRKVLKSYTALIGGSVLLSSMQAAQAAHGQNNISFREFRQQNAGLDRHVARGLFNSERRHAGASGIQLSTVTAGANRLNHANGANAIHFRHSGPAGVVKLQSLQVTDAGNLIHLNKGIDLDLTSNSRNITLGRKLFSDDTTSVQIQEGGELRTVTAGSQVTAAEYIAVKQALADGGQKITIDRSGTAVGGEVNLDAITGNNDVMRASDLVVAANVTTYGDFGKRSDFRLLGDLNNFGTVYATNSNDRKGGAIRADDIYNHADASINSTVDLTLDAAGNLSNDGSISSSGALTLIAGGAVRNSGSITSQNDLNLNASTVSNSGTVQSSAGNINLNGSSDAALSINNNGGTFNASNGSINIRSTEYNGAYDTNITGGDLLSRELNLNSGQGLMSVNVNQLSGTIGGTGTAAHVTASTDVLTIGKVCLTGDPTFYNSAGDIAITGDVTVQEALTIIASGDITTGTNVKVIAGDSKQGYDITMIAGAAFVATGGKNSPTLPALIGDAGSVQLTGKATKAGGSIVFGNGTQIIAQQQGGSGDLNGGDVLLFAFGGKDLGSGLVDTSNSVIFSGASGNGQNGDVLLVGGAKAGDAVIAGSIISNGGVGTTGGDVGLAASQPVGKNVSYAANGKLNGTGLIPSTKINKAAKLTITNAVPGTDLDVGGDLAIGGATVEISGETSSTGVTAIAFVNSLNTQGVGNVFSPVVIMKGIGSIGTDKNPFSVNSGALQFKVGGDAFVNEAAGGVLVAGSLIAGDRLVLNAPNRAFQMTFPDVVLAANVELNVAKFGGFGIAGANESITLRANDPSGPVFNGNFGGTKELVLDIASGIGDKLDYFQLGSGLGKVSLTAPDVYAVQLASNKKTEVSVFAVNHGAFHSIAGMNLRDSNVTKGDLEVISGNGTLTVGGLVRARDLIYINNAGDKSSSKLAILANTTIETYATSPSDGSIQILLGPSYTTPYSGPPIANVKLSTTGGTIDLQGNGFVAEAPENELRTLGTNALLTIVNDYAAKNFTLGGNVLIFADPPVAAGTPTIIINAPMVEKNGFTTSGVKFEGPYMMAGQNAGTEINTLGLSNSNATLSGINLNQTNDAVANLMTATMNAASSQNDDSYMMTTQPGRVEHDAIVRSELDSLNNGSILLVPNKDLKVSTPMGTINVAAGSTVLISVDSNQLSVYDFHDEQARGVSVEVDGKSIALSPGRHVCVTRDRFNAFADVNPIEAIPHRSMSRMDLNNGKAVFHSEFSMVNAANVIKPVRAILSAQDKETKKLAGKILKTTAAVLQVSGSSHPFELHAKPTAVVLSSL